MRRIAPRVRGLLVILIVVAGASAASGGLPRAPFRLSAVPATVEEGGQMTINVSPLTQEHDEVPSVPFDVYVSIIRDGDPEDGSPAVWAYLTPSGAWSATATPYRSALTLSHLSPIAVGFAGVKPIGWYRIRVQFVKASAPLPSRKHYVFQPLLVQIKVQPRSGSGAEAALVLVPLGALTVGAWILVVAHPLYGSMSRRATATPRRGNAP